MFKKDFLMRLIQEAIQGLHHVMGLRNAGKLQEAEKQIGSTMKDVVGLEKTAVDQFSHTQLLDILQLHHADEWRERAALLASLLDVQAQIAVDEDKEDEIYAYRLKALHLLLVAGSLEDSFFLPEFAIRPSDLVRSLTEEFILPTETYHAILNYYELANLLEMADNLLFECVPNDEIAVETAVEFYYHLLTKSDEELELGKLPRDEVKASLQEIQNYA